MSTTRLFRLLQRRTYATKPTNASENIFKYSSAAEFLASAVTTSSIPSLHGLPEIIVAGRANAGKSTLLNAVMGRKDLVHTSSKPGRTQALNFFRVGPPPGSLILVDAPGYGKRGRREWGALWDNYVRTRTQLRRIYILINAKHGLTPVDHAMLESLNDSLTSRLTDPKKRQECPTLHAVLTKVDEVPSQEAEMSIAAMRTEILKVAPVCEAILPTACSQKVGIVGIEALRDSMAQCAVRYEGSKGRI